MRPTVETYPVTPMQEGMLLHNLRAPHSGVDVVQYLCGFQEPLEGGPLRRAWQRAVDRHPALRTCFRIRGVPEPVQDVLERAVLDWRDVDLSELGEEARDRVVQGFLMEDRRRGFDLRQAPLLRVALFRCGDDRWRLIVTHHHTILDGRAVVAVFHEVFRLYAAWLAGEPEPELPSRRPFGDFCRWLADFDHAGAEGFWRDHLEGAEAGALGIVRSLREETRTAHGYRIRITRMSPDWCRRLAAVAETHGLTLNTLVTGAWALLVSRYSARSEAIFGTTRACRYSSLDGSPDMVGMLINTLPFRVPVHFGRPLVEWLRGVRERWIRVRPHEHTPLPLVRQWSGVQGGARLFDSHLVYDHFSLDSAMRRLDSAWERRSFDLIWHLDVPLILHVFQVDTPDGLALELRLGYDRRQVGEQATVRLLDQIRCLLRNMVRNLESGGQAPPETLRMLSREERHRLVHELSLSRRPGVGEGEPVTEAVARWARVHPRRVALEEAGKTINFGELLRRADLQAAALRRRGAGCDRVVAVWLDRGLEQVVTLLAVLRSGAAYLPMDPAIPAARVQMQLEDAGAIALVTDPSRAQRLADPTVPVLEVRDLEAEGKEDREVPFRPPLITPEQLAYVIFTSGSTGRPKGVMVSHGALAHLVAWHRRAFGIVEADRATALANPAFDASVWELWPHLASGIRVAVLAQRELLSPAGLQGWLLDRGSTVAFLPTPLAEELLHLAWPSQAPLRCLLTGGDRLHHHPPPGLPFTLVNNYGPTENAVVSTSGPVPADGAIEAEAPHIGRPVGRVRIYLLDHLGQLVPEGASGEICLAGPALARGYSNRPRSTAGTFVPDPFSREPGGRLYRTGDLARWRSDGTLDFLGRRDEQVKVRGFRIELGEIEAALESEPGVRDAAVIVAPQGQGDRLVAFVVPAPGARPLGRTLRDALRARLPEYMVPVAVELLHHLPITNNGKLDRRHLRELAAGLVVAEAASLPATEMQRAVAAVWCEQLGLETVGIDQNFFDLGGNSLLMMRLHERIEMLAGRSLSVVDLFDHPTIRDLTRHIGDRREREGEVGALIPRDLERRLNAGKGRMMKQLRLVAGD